MKKVTFISFTILFILIICSASIYANQITFSSVNTKLKIGDEFVSTITISSDKTINGVEFSLNYDTDTFELESVSLQDTENYVLFSSSAESIDILSLKGNNVPLVADITLKVTDSAKTSNYTISTSDIKINFLEDESTQSFEAVSISAYVQGINNINYSLWILIFITIIIISVVFLILIKHKKNKSK